MKELQGTWNITALEIDGGSMPAAGTVTVKGTRFVSLGLGATYEGTLKIDAKAKPHSIDMVFTKGPEKGNTNLGIFEIDGDTWRLCLDMTGKARPTKFSTKGSKGRALETLTRATVPAKVKNGKAALPRLEPSPELEGEWQMKENVTSGKPLDTQWLPMGKRIARNNETTVMMGPQTILKAKYTVDRSTPGNIQYFLPDGRTRLGIYRLAGNTLTVNFAAPGKPRPVKLASTKGDDCTFTVWQKLK